MDEEQKEKRAGLGWAGSIFITFVIYLLAPGPLMWLYVNGYISENVKTCILIFYFPLVFLAEKNRMIEETITWYLKLWGG